MASLDFESYDVVIFSAGGAEKMGLVAYFPPTNETV